MQTPHKKLPAELVARFCDAIRYAKDERAPSPQEQIALGSLLRDLSRWAHRANVAPERILIELKISWTRTCGRDPSPDMNDPLWSALVRIALDAYERARVEAA